MSVERWDPFGEMGALHDRVNRLFDEMWSRSERPASGGPVWAPLVDILETEEAIVLRAEVAGVKQEDLEIELDGDTLTLSGERKADDVGATLRIERPRGRFRRSFTIGVPVDQAKARATCREGLLEITLPKSRERRPRQVKVQVE